MKIYSKLVIGTTLLLLFACKEDYTNVSFGTVEDNEGNSYRTITINELETTWMAQNLEVVIDADSTWCYNDDLANCEKYGRLYSTKNVAKACESLGGDWRVPTPSDWKELADYYGGYVEVKSSTNITEHGKPEEAYERLLLGGISGFEAVLGGEGNIFFHNDGASYNSLESRGSYWAIDSNVLFGNLSLYTEKIEFSRGLRQIKISSSIDGFFAFSRDLRSCRCIKNTN